MHFIMKQKRDKEKMVVIRCTGCGKEEIHQSGRTADQRKGKRCTCGRGRWLRVN